MAIRASRRSDPDEFISRRKPLNRGQDIPVRLEIRAFHGGAGDAGHRSRRDQQTGRRTLMGAAALGILSLLFAELGFGGLAGDHAGTAVIGFFIVYAACIALLFVGARLSRLG